MQALEWLASPGLPALTAEFQPEAVLWMAVPAYGPRNETWAVHHLLANFSGGPPPMPTGRGPPPVPSRFEFVETTMWCAPSLAEAQPLIDETSYNALNKFPLVNIGPGPVVSAEGRGFEGEGEREDGGGGVGGSAVEVWVIVVIAAAFSGA